MDSNLLRKFTEGARQLGVRLEEPHLECFKVYARKIMDYGGRANITGCRTPEDIFLTLFLGSLACLRPASLEDARSLLDLGAGAGIPGIPLKIVFPRLSLVLLEAREKKADFLREACGDLGLKNTEVLLGRAEDVGHVPGRRECFERLVARAVAPFRVLAEYALPFLAVGGRMVVPLGKEGEHEATGADRAIRLLGGETESVERILMPCLGKESVLVVVRKVAATDERYPRRAGIPAKRPL